jgi:hypothetical protein
MNRITPQPLITVRSVKDSSRWYQHVLNAASGHGGDEYEQLVVDGELVLQLHNLEIDHHHGAMAEAGDLGNGVALWFRAVDFDETVGRIRSGDVAVTVQTDVHVNPNANQREIWLRDPDSYLVVIAEPYRG